MIDDDEAVRQSLAFLLRSARIEVETYECAAAFLAALPAAGTGCVVTDVRMPEMSGVELLRRLNELDSRHAGDRHHRPWRRAAGGRGDEARRRRFHREAVRRRGAAGRRAIALSQRHGRQQAQRGTRGDRTSKLASLSKREREVLDGLVGGQPNKTIAYDLGISPRTVEIYRANVMTKMQAASLSELVRMALVAGILDRAQKPKARKASR